MSPCFQESSRFVWSKDDCEFSPSLTQCHPPVLKLFGAGHLSAVQGLSASPGLAIVGSRKASAQGLADARWFARQAAQAGLTIISGLAQGIDGQAHRGALDAGAKTVAVLGHGLDHIYPPEHRGLRDEIVSLGGALITEFNEQVPAKPFHFPLRNRIIAALSRAILIVEAAPQSGSLITARHALELGIDVFVIPGSIHQAQSIGSNGLIRQGAQPVQSPEELLQDLGLRPPPKREEKRAKRGGLVPQDPRCEALKRGLGFAPAHVQILAQASQLSEADVFAGLLLLELQGAVKRHADGRWSLYKDHNNS